MAEASLLGPASGEKDADLAKCQVSASLTPEAEVTADRNAAGGLHGADGRDCLGAPAASDKRTATSVERVKTSSSSARPALGHGCPTDSSVRGHRSRRRERAQSTVPQRTQPSPAGGEVPQLSPASGEVPQLDYRAFSSSPCCCIAVNSDAAVLPSDIRLLMDTGCGYDLIARDYRADVP